MVWAQVERGHDKHHTRSGHSACFWILFPGFFFTGDLLISVMFFAFFFKGLLVGDFLPLGGVWKIFSSMHPSTLGETRVGSKGKSVFNK